MTSQNTRDTDGIPLSPLSPDRPSEPSSQARKDAALTEANRSTLPRCLLTVEEAAETLGMGRTATFEQVRLGRLKSVRVGRSRRIPIDYIDDFVALLKSEADAESAA